ncbi:MAG: hypothetical protein V2I82_09535 [Halieaceae bacterium]|jgi:hypothetical protein|nr:hypothetical protein [Halieaceae bacterium]
MANITDPTKLDKEELIAEWAVREEELRLQFESLKAAQTQAQVLLQRYERIFSFCPLPLMVIDNRAEVKELNTAARMLVGRSLQGRSNLLLNALTEESRLEFTQALRRFMSEDAAKAQQLTLEFRDVGGLHPSQLVSLDTHLPPDNFVLILTPGKPEQVSGKN